MPLLFTLIPFYGTYSHFRSNHLPLSKQYIKIQMNILEVCDTMYVSFNLFEIICNLPVQLYRVLCKLKGFLVSQLSLADLKVRNSIQWTYIFFLLLDYILHSLIFSFMFWSNDALSAHMTSLRGFFHLQHQIYVKVFNWYEWSQVGVKWFNRSNTFRWKIILYIQGYILLLINSRCCVPLTFSYVYFFIFWTL